MIVLLSDRKKEQSKREIYYELVNGLANNTTKATTRP